MCCTRPITFIHITPQSLLAPKKQGKGSGNRRDRLRDELRTWIAKRLRECPAPRGDDDFDMLTVLTGRLTRVRGARMAYCPRGYAALVRRYRLKLVGWPSDIPFTHLNEIRGGVAPIETLHTAWREGVLTFERATAEDVANAVRDPLSVHPNPGMIARGDGAEGAETDAGGRGGIVEAVAHHPGSLNVLGTHPTSTQPHIDLEERPRDQRSDVKRPHVRAAEERPLKRPRRARDGVKSSRYVLSSDEEDEPSRGAKRGITFWMVNDPVEEFRAAVESDESIEAFTESERDEIESASGFSTGEGSSEIEEC